MAKKMMHPLIAKTMDLRNLFYEAGDPRRRQERYDSTLVEPDNHAIANLPETGYQREFMGRRRDKDIMLERMKHEEF